MAITDQQKHELEFGQRLLVMRRREAALFNPPATWAPVAMGSGVEVVISGRNDKLPSTPTPDPIATDAGDTWPEKVKIYPDLAFKAKSQGSRDYSAFRAWCLARALDKTGLGSIPIHRLIEYMTWLGFPDRTIRSWLQRARETRLLRRCGTKLVITGIVKASVILDVTAALRPPALLNASDLTDNKSMGVVWNAFLLREGGRPISRSKLSQITGISARQQYNYEKETRVDHRKNYARFDFQAKEVTEKHLEGVKNELGHKGAFIVAANKKRRRKAFIYIRLPDVRRVTRSNVERANQGRTRKINKALRVVSSTLCEEAQGNTTNEDNTKGTRLFYEDSGAARRSVVQWGRKSLHREIREVFSPIEYHRQNNTKPFLQWEIIPNWSLK